MKSRKQKNTRRRTISKLKSQKNIKRPPKSFDEIYGDLKTAGWGKDLLTQNIETAFCNIGVTFIKLKPYYELLKKANEIFNEAYEIMSWEQLDGFIADSLYGRSIGCFFGAIRLSMSGQLPEAWALLRACIENSLYAFYIYGNPERAEIWVNRHENDESKRKCKNTFLIGNIWEELQKKSPTITKEAKKVYEQTIDWGAHPNERSLFPNIVPKSDGASYALRILNAEPGFLKATIIYTIIVSTLIFRIFSLMLPEIFNQPNLDIKIQNLKKQSTLLMLDASKQLRTMAK